MCVVTTVPGQAVSVSGSPNSPHSFLRPVHFSWAPPPMSYVLPSFQSSLFKKTEKPSLSHARFRPHFLNDGFLKSAYLTS